MTRYPLDTNHVGEALSRVSKVRDLVQRRHRQGDTFSTCGPVLCELQVGFDARKDSLQCRKRLDTLLQIVRVWPVDRAVAEKYSEIYRELRVAGRSLSQVDMMLAALARNTRAVLLTTDLDFQALPDIQSANWIG